MKAMAAYGIREDDIAGVIGIAPKTLRKHFRRELDIAHIEANAKVAESLFRKATGDGSQAVTAAIWWTKARMGWKETVINENTGANGGPIRHAFEDLDKLDTADLARVYAEAVSTAGGGERKPGTAKSR